MSSSSGSGGTGTGAAARARPTTAAMVAPSASCPLCYEAYALGEDPLLVPRWLPCGDVACTGCLRDSLDEGSRALVCQSCLRAFVLEAATVEAGLPAVAMAEPAIAPEEEDEAHEGEGHHLHGAVLGLATPTSSSSTASNSGISSGISSRLAQFMRTVPASAVGPDEGPPPQPSPSVTPRALSAAEQAAHARAHQRLAEAKLSRLRFQRDGDQAKVDLQASPGGAAHQASAREPSAGEGAEGPWGRLDPDELAARFKAHKLMELGEALELIDRSREVLSKEPNILHIQAPVACVGDIHGQYHDLLHLMERGGRPADGVTYLFLGDYVDRGKYSCEVMLYLLALKVCYPERVFLIRGNHESRGTTGFFGFKEECLAKLGLPAYYRFLLAFECMPLAAVIETNYGRIFAAHGGISPDIRTLAEIEALDRFVEPDCKGALCDILWSDPLHELEPSVAARPQTLGGGPEPPPHADDEAGSVEEGEFLRVEFRPNYERGCSYYFGYRAVRRFLDENGLLCLVRAHQVQEEGFRRHFDPLRQQRQQRRRDSRGGNGSTFTHDNVRELLPPVITVFSAPNYAGRYRNKAAFLRVGLEPEEMSFEQFECVPAPHLPGKLPWAEMAMASGHRLAATNTCPYMPTTFRELFKVALELNSLNVAASSASSADVEGGTSLSRQTSDGSFEPTLTPCDSLTSLGSSSCSASMDDDGPAATAAAGMPAPALQESGSLPSLLGAEADALTDGERGSSLGSTGLEEDGPHRSVLRDGSAIDPDAAGPTGRWRQAPEHHPWPPSSQSGSKGAAAAAAAEARREPAAAAITTGSRVFAVIQQFEDANSRTRKSKHPPSSPPRRRASTATAAASATTAPTSLQRRAAQPRQPKEGEKQKHQQQQQPQAKEPRPAMASPGRSSRRSSGGNSDVVASPSVAPRSSLYMLAQARDGINEMHPEVLERRIQAMATKLDRRRSQLGDPAVQAGALSAGGKDAFDTVSSCQRVTVTELCARFELGMLLRASETMRSPDRDRKPEPKAEQPPHPHEWPAGRDEAKEEAKGEWQPPPAEQVAVEGLETGVCGQGGKLAATGVRELRSLFEVYSKRHVEKQFIISSGTTTPSLSRGASGSDLGTLSAMSASKAKLSLLLPSHHDGAPFPPNRHHDGLPVSPTFRRPAARVGLGDKEEEEQQQQGACDRAPTVENSEQPQQQPQQQPAAASPGEGDGSSETGAAGGQQQPSHAQSPAAAVEIFTHDEIVCLRLIFALFDDNGDDFVDEGELLRYAEETGDHASLNQAAECIRLLDVDGDGRIGLWDYVNFAARLKELHRTNERSLVMDALRQRFQETAAAQRRHES